MRGADSNTMQQGGEHAASAHCNIPTVTDVLMHTTPDGEGSADRQPWCGGDAAQTQKGALGSRERRKRKRKEVCLRRSKRAPSLLIHDTWHMGAPINIAWILGLTPFAYPSLVLSPG